jgi:thymidylate synthase (FAD)
VKVGQEAYKEALADGVAPEQARLLLPAYAMYVRWRWTASLNAVLHFLELRTHEHAQSEIRAYADGVQLLVDQHFPVASEAWRLYR